MSPVPAAVFEVMAMGGLAGLLGSLLGIGGGVFLVPFLLFIGLPFRGAAGVSLMTVIASSSAVSASSAGLSLVNVRLGMILEIATTLGGLFGGLTAAYLSERTLTAAFAIFSAIVAIDILRRLDQKNVILDLSAEPGRLGGRYYEPERQREVIYRVKRLPVAILASFVAGNASGLLGIGGGVLKVPALNAWCGVPIRAAAATSSLMIGVTAVATAPLYYARGDVVPQYAAAAVVGVLVGSRIGLWLAARARVRWLKILMAVVLFAVAAVMASRLR